MWPRYRRRKRCAGHARKLTANRDRANGAPLPRDLAENPRIRAAFAGCSTAIRALAIQRHAPGHAHEPGPEAIAFAQGFSRADLHPTKFDQARLEWTLAKVSNQARVRKIAFGWVLAATATKA